MILITRALGIVMTSYSLNGSIIPYNTWWGLLSWAIIGVAVIVLFIFLYKKGDKIERWFLNKFDSLRKRKKGEKIVGEIEEEKLPSEKNPRASPRSWATCRTNMTNRNKKRRFFKASFLLFRSEYSVARVAECGHDITLFVERRIRIMRDINFHVGMSLCDFFHP